MVLGKGFEDRALNDGEVREIVQEACQALDVRGKKVLIIVPDRTRTAPIPYLFRLFHEFLGREAFKLDYLVALGTHQPLPEASMNALFGISEQERSEVYGDVGLFNHEWQDPDTFVTLGTISREEIVEILPDSLDESCRSGLLRDVPVTLNRKIFDYDHVIVCGPTFPHEVAGFSGGNKYFFPGISGPEVINYSHWLGAVISSFEIIGTQRTPVRDVIDRAASMIDRPKSCFSLVVKGSELAGLYVGTPEEAFDAAATLSSKVHIRWLDRPVRKVLSVMPEMYDDIWTAAKGMYKMEPVVEDGGEVIIYAPHIDEISYTHGRILDEIGYHVCEYFLKQWERFEKYPGGVLAHSTHATGNGSYDAETGEERPRVKVTLATGIPKERCERLNLGYLDYRSIDPDTWESTGENYLMVPKAGELLYRLKSQAK